MTRYEALTIALYEIDEIITGERNLLEENMKNSYYCYLKEHIEELQEVVKVIDKMRSEEK